MSSQSNALLTLTKYFKINFICLTLYKHVCSVIKYYFYNIIVTLYSLPFPHSLLRKFSFFLFGFGAFTTGLSRQKSNSLLLKMPSKKRKSSVKSEDDVKSKKTALNDGEVTKSDAEKDFVVLKGGHRYKGELLNGLPQGKGTMLYPDGSTYNGELKGGIRQGTGIMTLENGTYYEGEYQNDKIHGKGILIISKDGIETYEGEFENGLPHGKGKHTFTDEKKYDGEFQNGKRHGKGIMTFPDGEKYDGEFQNGLYHGKGIVTFPNGTKYEGQFEDDNYHGNGVMTFMDGTIYEGEFQNDNFHGVGKITSNDCDNLYAYATGKFIEGICETPKYFDINGKHLKSMRKFLGMFSSKEHEDKYCLAHIAAEELEQEEEEEELTQKLTKRKRGNNDNTPSKRKAKKTSSANDDFFSNIMSPIKKRIITQQAKFLNNRK